MARADANINKETLSFICLRIGVTVAYLSQRAGQTEERVSAWLDTSNTDYPTINQAKGLAKVLKVPFAGLYMDKDILPVKQLPTLRNLRTLPYEIAMDDSSLNLAVVELIRYRDFLTSSESDMKIEAVPLSLPAIAINASVIDFATTIRLFFDIKLDDQFKLTSPRQFYLFVQCSGHWSSSPLAMEPSNVFSGARQRCRKAYRRLQPGYMPYPRHGTCGSSSVSWPTIR